MRELTVIVRDVVDEYLIRLMRYVASRETEEAAVRYVKRIRKEIDDLSYLAPMLPKSNYLLPLRYHKDAKAMTVGKRKLTVIFHVDGEYVIVDKILPAGMITY